MVHLILISKCGSMVILMQVSGAFQLKDEKSVSRQHLTLSVSNVTPGDGVGVPTVPGIESCLIPVVARAHTIRDQRQGRSYQIWHRD